MKSAKQPMENMEYVRTLLEQKQLGFVAHLNSPFRWPRQSTEKPVDDELIRL